MSTGVNNECGMVNNSGSEPTMGEEYGMPLMRHYATNLRSETS